MVYCLTVLPTLVIVRSHDHIFYGDGVYKYIILFWYIIYNIMSIRLKGIDTSGLYVTPDTTISTFAVKGFDSTVINTVNYPPETKDTA